MDEKVIAGASTTAASPSSTVPTLIVIVFVPVPMELVASTVTGKLPAVGVLP